MSGIATLNHKALTALAVKWLRRQNSQGGHGCIVAASELRSGWDGEIPDAIGFQINGNTVISIVIEAKATRSDFLADKKKLHREAGMGRYRYYICPTGLIKPDELPEKWGLIYANERGHLKVVAGPASKIKDGYVKYNEALRADAFEPDSDREQWLLVRLLSRVGDVEQMNEWIKESKRQATRYLSENIKLREDLKNRNLELMQLKLSQKDPSLFNERGVLKRLEREEKVS